MIQAVILAAGMGTRLGRELPKPLTPLNDGRTIMQQQIDNLHLVFGFNIKITVVVGYLFEYIVDAFPELDFVYNERYDQTNTSKSLLRALKHSKSGGVLWLNGDVVFDPDVLRKAASLLNNDTSFVTVNRASVQEEEVKYTTDIHGYIHELSKKVSGGLGEAVGINYISSGDKHTFIQNLKKVDDQDYFERGLELSIENNHMRIEPLDISHFYAVEVDFQEDLERANLFV